jgi:hypothetical protein
LPASSAATFGNPTEKPRSKRSVWAIVAYIEYFGLTVNYDMSFKIENDRHWCICNQNSFVEPVSVIHKRVSAQLHDSRTEIGKFRTETEARFSRFTPEIRKNYLRETELSRAKSPKYGAFSLNVQTIINKVIYGWGARIRTWEWRNQNSSRRVNLTTHFLPTEHKPRSRISNGYDGNANQKTPSITRALCAPSCILYRIVYY